MPSGNYVYWRHFNFLFKNLRGVEQFRVQQEDVSKLSLFLVTNRDYRQSVHEPRIMGFLNEVGGPDLDVEIIYVDSIPIPPSGKVRYIIPLLTDIPR